MFSYHKRTAVIFEGFGQVVMNSNLCTCMQTKGRKKALSHSYVAMELLLLACSVLIMAFALSIAAKLHWE